MHFLKGTGMKRREILKQSVAGAWAVAGSVATPLLPMAKAATTAAPVKIGMLIPLSGPASLFGPSSRNCAVLGAEEINARGGLSGRPIELLFGDAGLAPPDVQREALKLWRQDHVQAFVGMHDSAVRQALVTAFKGEVPYVYTATYEGGECSRGTYVLGETPSQQLRSVIPWLSWQRGLKRWYLIGNDYSWPRNSNVVAKEYVAEYGGSVVGEEYLPFTATSFEASLARIKESKADAVLVTLVGGASVAFNRAFAAAGLADKVVRLGTLIEENTLMGIGAQNSANLYASSGYFATIRTKEAKAFTERYKRRFGEQAPILNVLAQSCYEGLRLLEAMVLRSHSLEVAQLETIAQWTISDGPRGTTVLHARHAVRDIYLAQAEGAEFRVVRTFEAVRTGQECML
jgi:urea transport system substrate-binding protein